MDAVDLADLVAAALMTVPDSVQRDPVVSAKQNEHIVQITTKSGQRFTVAVVKHG